MLNRKESGNHFLESIRSKVGAFWDYRKIFWKLRSYLSIPPTSGWEHLWRCGNNENHIKHLYTENLKIALNSVKGILRRLDGKTIITSDHGEAFGEHNEWGHRTGVSIPSLVKVPWLEVE